LGVIGNLARHQSKCGEAQERDENGDKFLHI
jgi:hypothetical protein